MGRGRDSPNVDNLNNDVDLRLGGVFTPRGMETQGSCPATTMRLSSFHVWIQEGDDISKIDVIEVVTDGRSEENLGR